MATGAYNLTVSGATPKYNLSVVNGSTLNLTMHGPVGPAGPAGTGGSGAAPVVSAEPPATPTADMLWTRSTDGSLNQWDAVQEVWVNLSHEMPAATDSFLPLSISYYTDLLAAGNEMPLATVTRLDSAFQVLDDAGILTNLVDGAVYCADSQVATGLPISLRGVAATSATGAIVRGDYGFAFDYSNAQSVIHPMASVVEGTLAVDYSYNHDDIKDFQEAISIGNAAGNNKPLLLYDQGGGRLQMASFNSPGSTAISDYVEAGTNGAPDRMVWMRFKTQQRVVAHFGAAPTTIWVEGIDSTPADSWAYTSAVDTTKVTVGGFATAYFKGEHKSWMAFDKLLTETEARAANTALALLSSQPVNFIAEGDSWTQPIYELLVAPVNGSNVRTPWTDYLRSEAGWDAVRIVNIASSGQTLAAILDTWADQSAFNVIEGKRNIYSCEGAINDIGFLGTGVQAYADLVAILALAKAAGCETMGHTMGRPTVGGAWTQGMDDEMVIYNNLVRAGHVTGDFDYLVDIDAAIPDHAGDNAALWYDIAHINNTGHEIYAGLVAAAITL